MKVSFPLSLKVSLWLLLNLLLLAAAGAVFYWTQFGRGWESLATGALGERLQATADRIVGEAYAAPADEREQVLLARGERTGAELFFFQNDGVQVAGRPVTLPEKLRAEMLRGSRRGPAGGGEGPGPFGRGGPGGRPPPGGGAGADMPPPKRGPLGEFGRPAAEGRIVVRAGPPAETWIGVRVPLLRDGAPPVPGTLVLRVPSLLALLRVFEVLPWLGLAAGAIVLSVLFWLPLVGGMTRALRRLSAATEAIAEGRFDTRVPATRRDELGHLGQSVNRMAARLDTLVNGQKRFLGDVAHELGSPLGRLQVATEILETRAGPALRDHVADVREEVQHMAALVNELLAFTKAGLRPRDAELAAVDLAPLVAATLQREAAAEHVTVGDLAGLAVRADGHLLGKALGNLVRNALRHAGDAGPITVTARRAGERIFVAVEDHGPGVPPEALARLGEPFYRPEAARTRETGGAGLGLAIVRSSVTACGGEVRFANRTPHGFRAEIELAAA